MSSETIGLIVKPRGKPISRLPDDFPIPPTASLSDLYAALAETMHLSPHRLRLTKGSDGSLLPNTPARTISSTSLRNASTIYVKDLGPQISWRAVFVIEYIGPLLIHPLIYLLRPFLYANGSSTPSPAQITVLWLVVLHFAKRELETLFVHRFSLATMPARNILKNSAHYWLLAGLNIAYWVYAPTSPTAGPVSPLLYYPGLLFYVFGELANLSTHLTLRGLRSAGGTERGIPQGFGFGVVTCPNYMFETLAWVGMWLVSGLSWSVLLFIVVAGAQMALWGKKKERRLRGEFGAKYQHKRFVMIPLVV